MIADDQTRAKIFRLSSLKSFERERDDFVFNTLVDFKPVERFKYKRYVMKSWCFCGGSSC